MLAMERSGMASAIPAPRSPMEMEALQRTISGGHGGGDTPVPIPNTAVKPASADGTWGETPWESRTSPGSLDRSPPFAGASARLKKRFEASEVHLAENVARCSASCRVGFRVLRRVGASIGRWTASVSRC